MMMMWFSVLRRLIGSTADEAMISSMAVPGTTECRGGKGDDVLQGGAGRDRVDGGNALTLIGVDMLTLHQDDSLF